MADLSSQPIVSCLISAERIFHVHVVLYIPSEVVYKNPAREFAVLEFSAAGHVEVGKILCSIIIETCNFSQKGIFPSKIAGLSQ